MTTHREAPYTPAELEELVSAQGSNYVTGNVAVALEEILGAELDQFLDLLGERLVGSPLLMDIHYKVAGVLDEQSLILSVSGDVSAVLDDAG